MRLLLLSVIVSAVCGLTIDDCERVEGDHIEYTCWVGNNTVTIAAQINSYAKLDCEGTNITCADIPRFNFANGLPLPSLGIQSCPPSIVRCVNEVVDATSFEVVTLRSMNGLVTKEDVENLGDVKVLTIVMTESETSLPIAAITSFPSLRSLVIGEGDIQLSSNIFNHPSLKHLEYLEVRQNGLKSIPSGTFQGFESLKVLNIWSNDIDKIENGAFKGLNAIEEISLNNNKLRHLYVGVFNDTLNLKALNLKINKIESLPNGLLQGLRYLENITMHMNSANLSLDSHTFSNLPSLKNILLTECRIQSLPETIFLGSENIEILTLTNNMLEALPIKVFLNLKALKRLDLSFNRIKELNKGVFAGLKKMEVLNLNRNHLESLPEFLFSGPSNLKELSIDHNSIKTIAWNTFQGSNLHSLSLSYNKLSLETSSEYANVVLTSPFQFLTQLRRLNLSNNEIRTMFYDWMIIMTRLEYLDLAYNRFKELWCDQHYMQFISANVTVNLEHNDISLITLDLYVPQLTTLDTNSIIIINDNPLVCDCHLYGLKKRIEEKRSMPGEPKFVVDNAKCHSPDNLKSLFIKNVVLDDFLCEVPEFLPETCQSVVAKVSTNELIVTCPYLPAVLPDIKNETFYYYFGREPLLTVNLDHQPVSIDGLNINKINLSNSGIDEINFIPNEFLKILDISHNNLKSIPLTLLNNNISLYLANNSLECECGYEDDLIALKKYNYIEDYELIFCSNGANFADLDVTALCNTWKAAMTAIGTFLILGIIFIMAASIMYRYSTEILIYISSRGLCRCCITQIQLDKDKEYDLFISFSHQDAAKIQDVLVPRLENDFDQKLCLHYRDWIVGDPIPTQIFRSVENSRKTVILLSENYLNSDWANMEFVAAHNLAIKDGKARLILIILDENVLKNEKLSDELRAYISTNTYLLWDDPKFWEKMYKVIPKIEHRFTWLEVLRNRNNDYDKNYEKCGLDVQLNSEGKLINIARKDEEKILNDILSV